eukprot:6411738-Alexandrium_andersonii.AAC.1
MRPPIPGLGQSWSRLRPVVPVCWKAGPSSMGKRRADRLLRMRTLKGSKEFCVETEGLSLIHISEPTRLALI